MRKGLAASTLKSYDFAWKTYAMFCMSLSVPSVPVCVNVVCAFVCHCTDVRHFQPRYIKGLVAGIQFNARCLDPAFPSLFTNPAVKLLFKGIGKVFPAKVDDRLPFTLSILHAMLSVLRRGCFSPYIDSLLDCTFSMAFYGFLRCGKFTTRSNVFNPATDVCVSDLTFHPDFFNLLLKHSKTGGSCNVIVANIGGPYCPFSSMLKYVKMRPPSGLLSPLFITPTNNPMSQSWFSHHLSQVVAKCDLPSGKYSGHSFRIGAATSAALQGVSTASLQQLGRWSSSAYSSYIRPDSAAIIEAQRSLRP